MLPTFSQRADFLRCCGPLAVGFKMKRRQCESAAFDGLRKAVHRKDPPDGVGRVASLGAQLWMRLAAGLDTRSPCSMTASAPLVQPAKEYF